jgi:hypothetical protein
MEKSQLKMTSFTSPLVFAGLLLRTALEATGFKKMARKLDWLEDVLNEDYRRDDSRDPEPGWFGKAFFGVGMMILMIIMGIFTEIYTHGIIVMRNKKGEVSRNLLTFSQKFIKNCVVDFNLILKLIRNFLTKN